MSLGEYFMVGSVGQKRVPTDYIANFKVALPPMEDQKQIVQHIKAKTTKINAAISRIEREIALIQEYKQSLIAEAITGKLNVRQSSSAKEYIVKNIEISIATEAAI